MYHICISHFLDTLKIRVSIKCVFIKYKQHLNGQIGTYYQLIEAFLVYNQLQCAMLWNLLSDLHPKSNTRTDRQMIKNKRVYKKTQCSFDITINCSKRQHSVPDTYRPGISSESSTKPHYTYFIFGCSLGPFEVDNLMNDTRIIHIEIGGTWWGRRKKYIRIYTMCIYVYNKHNTLHELSACLVRNMYFSAPNSVCTKPFYSAAAVTVRQRIINDTAVSKNPKLQVFAKYIQYAFDVH